VKQPAPLRAAGGLLARRVAGQLRLAIVHRTRYGNPRDAAGGGDWSLPKGKLEDDESFADAAVREVEEETGCRGQIVGAPLRSEYQVAGRPKVVLFFPMAFVEDGGDVDADEVSEVLWLTPEAALARLSYESERAIVRQAFAS
jgi:8-oxo-dGTP pyrophosphatase MutT (NUDIX family)